MKVITRRARIEGFFSEGKYAHANCQLATVYARRIGAGYEGCGLHQLPDALRIDLEPFTAAIQALAGMPIPAATMERSRPSMKSRSIDGRICVVASDNTPPRQQHLQ